jgi:hypothetical protein
MLHQFFFRHLIGRPFPFGNTSFPHWLALVTFPYPRPDQMARDDG